MEFYGLIYKGIDVVVLDDYLDFCVNLMLFLIMMNGSLDDCVLEKKNVFLFNVVFYDVFKVYMNIIDYYVN